MRIISETDPDYFEKEETATDIHGDELCPIWGCCPLLEAGVMPGSIFQQAERIQTAKPFDKRLVCAGGCTRKQRNA